MRWTRTTKHGEYPTRSLAWDDEWTFDIIHHGPKVFTLNAWKPLHGNQLNGAESGRIEYTLHFNRLKDAKAAAKIIASNRADK